MALFNKSESDAEVGRVYEEMLKASAAEPRIRCLVKAKFNAGWIAADPGKPGDPPVFVMLTAQQAEALKAWVEPANPAIAAIVKDGPAAKVSDDPPGAPPPIVTGQMSSQIDAGGAGRKGKKKG